MMYLSRIAQVLVTLAILGLDIYVIAEWNKNQYGFNSALGHASDISTWVGGTPYTGIVMFTVSHPIMQTLVL
jgi:hypothetical protein